MRNLILILGLALLIPARASWAQVAAPGDSGVSMGHVHFLVPDVDAAKAFWTAMGGVPEKLGPNDVFKFPGVLILVRKGEGTTRCCDTLRRIYSPRRCWNFSRT
jgi:hypothetical protein